MVHKKYTYKRGKRYGPYLYENKRVGDRIVTTYLGPAPKRDYKKIMGFVGILVIALVVISMGSFYVGELVRDGFFSPPHEYVNVELASLVPGEVISGDVTVELRVGELLPDVTLVVLGLDEVLESKTLSELVDTELLEGEFYIEIADISGGGKGFGLIGEREIYPEISFEYMILDVEETPTLPPSVGGGADDQEEPEEESEELLERAARYCFWLR